MKTHYCDWASQPNLHFVCGISTTPKWGAQPEGLPVGVYQEDDGDLYTFSRVTYVDCETCLAGLDEAIEDIGNAVLGED